MDKISSNLKEIEDRLILVLISVFNHLIIFVVNFFTKAIFICHFFSIIHHTLEKKIEF